VTEFDAVVRGRRMTRRFSPRPLPAGTVERLVDLASRAPSAGKTQGWHLVVLEGGDTARFWDLTLPAPRRAGFGWPTLVSAPVLAVVLADPQAYVDRYAEPDKAATGLGLGVDAWPTPYWTVDASMAVMTLLLAAEAEGIGALFFAVFHGVEEVRAELGVPAGVQLLGAIALGHPDGDLDTGRGRSAARPRRAPEQIVHRGRW
jgi:nitroreductase